jgi:hypothetical protein
MVVGSLLPASPRKQKCTTHYQLQKFRNRCTQSKNPLFPTAQSNKMECALSPFAACSWGKGVGAGSKLKDKKKNI